LVYYLSVKKARMKTIQSERELRKKVEKVLDKANET
jgi:hypothetical protein